MTPGVGFPIHSTLNLTMTLNHGESDFNRRSALTMKQFGILKEEFLNSFTVQFQHARYTTLVYNPRGWEESAGTP